MAHYALMKLRSRVDDEGVGLVNLNKLFGDNLALGEYSKAPFGLKTSCVAYALIYNENQTQREIKKAF